MTATRRTFPFINSLDSCKLASTNTDLFNKISFSCDNRLTSAIRLVKRLIAIKKYYKIFQVEKEMP